jgi:hypothetical protein
VKENVMFRDLKKKKKARKPGWQMYVDPGAGHGGTGL